VEFDTPWNLTGKEDGVFRNMCLKSGSFGELELTHREGKSGHTSKKVGLILLLSTSTIPTYDIVIDKFLVFLNKDANDK